MSGRFAAVFILSKQTTGSVENQDPAGKAGLT